MSFLRPPTGMDPKLRELYLRIYAEGTKEVHDITGPLHYLECNFPREKLGHALQYLIRKSITGADFVNWYVEKCHASNLEMHRELLRVVERDRYLRRLTAAKDLRQ